jgi:mono/diheme cytochrome c family protein
VRVAGYLYAGSLALGLGLGAAGCHESDIDPMMRQEKYKAYWSTEFYADGRAMRLPPANTVPRERTLDTTTSPPVTQALLERGHERYDIHCAVCHGYAGDSDSVVATKMSLRAPPTFHSEKLRAYTPAQIFDVTTLGYGYMPTYAAEVSVADRWAISHYVKALQISQRATVDDVPAAERSSLDHPAAPADSEHKNSQDSEHKE